MSNELTLPSLRFGPLRRLALVSSLACGAFAPAWGLDLAQAWQAALANDPQYQAARGAADATRERVPQARAQLLPKLGATAQLNRNNLRTDTTNFFGQPVTTKERYTSTADALTLRQPLFRPQLAAQLRQAKALVAQGDAQLDIERQRLVMRVTEAYLEVLRAEEQQRLLAVQRTSLAAQLDAARKGFAAGSGTRTDIDEAQARLDLQVAQELEGLQAVELGRRQLSAIVGQPVGALSAIAVERLPTTPPREGLEEWIARAEGTSPEVTSARAQAAAAREAVDMAKAEFLPTLDGTAQLLLSDSETPSQVNNRYYQKSIGVLLTVPLFDGFATRSRVRQALAEVERAEGLLRAASLDLSNRVHREFRGVTEGLARIRALEQAVRSSEQLVQSSRRSWQAGARTLLDILNAEQQLGTARRDLATARFNYLLSLIRLRALSGELAEPSIAEVNGWLVPTP
ncbi:MAG: type secretion outer membrane protein TolC family [Ramlibacter sp.]|jgi:outer membrane protein/protease secretion system outer membrane protein|nr:type secretion outer membrane protein TolC family [Ramlibacter sp.]